jgi:hypothetical protein
MWGGLDICLWSYSLPSLDVYDSRQSKVSGSWNQWDSLMYSPPYRPLYIKGQNGSWINHVVSQQEASSAVVIHAKSTAFSEKARSDIQLALVTCGSKVLQMLRTWPQRSLISGRLTQLTMLFCKRLTNSFLRYFARLPRGRWFRYRHVGTVWWIRQHTNWSIANGSLTGYRKHRNRPESLHQNVYWICWVQSSTRTGNIL